MKNSPPAFALTGRALFSTMIRADTLAVQTSVAKEIRRHHQDLHCPPSLPGLPPRRHSTCTSSYFRSTAFARATDADTYTRERDGAPSLFPQCIHHAGLFLKERRETAKNSRVDIHACHMHACTCTNQAATSVSHLRKHSYNAKVTERIHIYHKFLTPLRERKGSGVRSCHCMLISAHATPTDDDNQTTSRAILVAR